MAFSKPTQEQFAKILIDGIKSESFQKENKKVTGFDMDFTPESLQKYDTFLSKEYRKIKEPQLETLWGSRCIFW